MRFLKKIKMKFKKKKIVKEKMMLMSAEMYLKEIFN